MSTTAAASPYGAAFAHVRVLQHGDGEKRGVLAYLDVAYQRDVRMQRDVAGDPDVGAAPHQLGGDHGDAAVHQRVVDLHLLDAAGLGQLLAGIHAQALLGVVGFQRDGLLALAAQHRHGVGQVVLALRVVGAYLAQRLAKAFRVEAVEARVALADAGLLGGCVLLLDYARDGGARRRARSQVEPFADYAAVAERVVEAHGEHHGGRIVFRPRVGQRLDGLGSYQRAVAGKDDDRPFEA